MTVSLRLCRLEALTASQLSAWGELGLAAPCPNVFVMPQFVSAAARWLTPGRQVQVALFEQPARAGRELVGVGCFTLERPGLMIPVRHLRAYASEHSFGSGLLLAPGVSEDVARALARPAQRAPWQAIAFRNIDAAGEDFRALAACTQAQRGRWFELRRFQRPVLHLRPEQDAEACMKASVRKDLRRRWRRLEELGQVDVRIVRDEADLPAAVERHLQLEHAGWKAGAGSSMLSIPAHAAFFRELVAGFAATGAAALVELCVQGEVVASTSNFVVGGVVSAFKTGWDPRFARSSPGRLNEYALFQRMAAEWPGVRKFDSNAHEDSYLAQMIPDRDAQVTGAFALGPAAARCLWLARGWRPLAYRLGYTF